MDIQNTLHMNTPLFAIALSLLATLLLSVRAEPICKSVYPHALDIAIYWAHSDSNDNVVWRKACESNILDVFDPTKGVFLMTHGLQPNYVETGQRFTLEPSLIPIIRPYLGIGKNVGIFEWTQYADRGVGNFLPVESWIYATQTYRNIEYSFINKRGELEITDSPLNETIVDMFIREYRRHSDLMEIVNNEQDVHFIGHSLGTQVVTAAAYRIAHDSSIKKKMNHVTLLDEVISPGTKSYLFDYVIPSDDTKILPCDYVLSNMLGCFVEELVVRWKVAFDTWRSSVLQRCLLTSENNSLKVQHSAVVTVVLNAWGDQNLGKCYASDMSLDDALSPGTLAGQILDFSSQVYNQHTHIVPYYLMTLYYPPVVCKRFRENNGDAAAMRCNPSPTNEVTINAGSTSREVLLFSTNKTNYLGQKLCLRQFDDGTRDPYLSSTMTLTPEDDLFFLLPCHTVNT